VSPQPSLPSQGCSVTNGSGTVNAAAVTDITVTCSTNQFTVGGTLSGLAAGNSLVLQNNGGDDLLLSANGNFTFATALGDLSDYSVNVLTSPSNPAQSCTVDNGNGTLASGNVTDVLVTCETDQFTIGGSVSGLVDGTSLTLQNNGGDDLISSTNGSFVFATALDDLSSYAVSVLTQPTEPSQTCTVSNATGSLAGADIADVQVICQIDRFRIGGNVSGLVEGTSLTLQNNGGDDLPINADGSFTFATPLDDLSAYAVTILTQPTGPIQTCTVSNATGTLGGADVDDVAVACITEPPAVSLSAGTLDFGIVLDGETSSRSVTITNTGTGDLVIRPLIAPQAPFAISGGSCTAVPVTLLPGENCDIEIAFAPSTATGGFADQIVVVSNAASSPEAIALIGSARPLVVPTLDRFGLMVLVLLLAGFAYRGLRAEQNGSRPASSKA
jgi:hypothetical protein